MSNMVQCLVEKSGVTRQTAWIPAEFVQEFPTKEIHLELQDDDFGWSDGWKVIQVYRDTKLNSRWVQGRFEQDINEPILY
jgi:hypothetical protein